MYLIKKKKIISAVCVFIAAFLLLCTKAAAAQGKAVIYFTHDIHSYMDICRDEEKEHAGMGRLYTALANDGFYENGNALYLDGGDFSQGTLFQTGFEDEAFELRLLGSTGADFTTPGNHEWDHGGEGFAKMLSAALSKGEKLPGICISNLDFSGELTPEQEHVQKALKEYALKTRGTEEYRYEIITLSNGIKVGIFGVSGENSIEDSPTSGMKWKKANNAAKEMVDILEPQCDLIVCLSHSGTDDTGESGEDIELAKGVKGIDFILSAHSHSLYEEAVMVGETVIGSAGEYLHNVGKVEFDINETGKVSVTGYKLIPIDESLENDSKISEEIELAKGWISENYLSKYNEGSVSFDDVICESAFDMDTLSQMYSKNGEYDIGELIADSYIYEAEKNGIDDIDVALVALGTIRGSIKKGTVNVADAFGICSLGMGEDGSAGHPIVSAYITGKELKLLAQLDSSLGNMVSSIRMSYSGLSYSYNNKRMLLDRVTDICLIKDGKKIPIDDEGLYRVCCNMYAANMLGMLNGLTKGILSIVPKDKNGTPVTDLYAYSLKTPDGCEMKEWYAFKDYLSGFPDKNGNGTPDIPSYYNDSLMRKVEFEDGSLAARLADPGAVTIIAAALQFILAAAIAAYLTLIFIKFSRRKKH